MRFVNCTKSILLLIVFYLLFFLCYQVYNIYLLELFSFIYKYK